MEIPLQAVRAYSEPSSSSRATGSSAFAGVASHSGLREPGRSHATYALLSGKSLSGCAKKLFLNSPSFCNISAKQGRGFGAPRQAIRPRHRQRQPARSKSIPRRAR
jgi:hypothetical protein